MKCKEEVTITNEYCLERFYDWYKHGFSHSSMPSSGVLMKMGEALEKQIPKKPICKIYKSENIYLGTSKNYFCPSCNNGLIWNDDKYCPECGRRIDWSDYE